MPRIGANRPLNERVIFELGEDFQLADEDALGGGGAGAVASFAESALFVTAGWQASGVVTFDELYFGTADTLGVFPQLPATDIAVGPGLYNIYAATNPSDMGDATILSATLVLSATGPGAFLSPAQTAIFEVGGPVSWDNIDIAHSLFVPNGEVGDISVWTADDHTGGNVVVSDIILYIIRVFDFA